MKAGKLILAAFLFLSAGCTEVNRPATVQPDIRPPQNPSPAIERIVLEKYALRQFGAANWPEYRPYVCVNLSDSRGEGFIPSQDFCDKMEQMGYKLLDILTHPCLGSWEEGIRLGETKETSIYYYFRIVEARSETLFVIESGHEGGPMWRSWCKVEVEYRDGEIKRTKWLGGYVT